MDRFRFPRRRALTPFALAVVGGAVLSTTLGVGSAVAAEPGDRGCSPGLVSATDAPISGHIEKAHLERSPTMQAHDAQQTGDYLAMHQAWIQAFTAPARGGTAAVGATTSARTVSYVQQSPGSAQGASDPDAFVLRQTTWLQSALDPTEGLVAGGAC
jgi:hypothetical protein